MKDEKDAGGKSLNFADKAVGKGEKALPEVGFEEFQSNPKAEEKWPTTLREDQ